MLANALNKASGFITPAGIARPRSIEKHKLYAAEKKVLKEEFSKLGKNFNWNDEPVKAKLQEFARLVIKNTTQTVLGTEDLWSVVLPTEEIEPGDTFKLRELHGVNVYYGTYGASVRMSRPQFTEFSATTNLKEVGLKLELTQIRTGKYSPSELADYTAALITAWRNHLLFTTTLGGNTVYQSGGAQAVVWGGGSFGTMNAAIDKLTDEGDVKVIIGRRSAIHHLSVLSGWSEASKEEFENVGQVGKYAGIPVVQVKSFTDPDYGTVYPMPKTVLWFFSELPAGAAVIADRLRTADEVILANETMNIFFRWDDGIGIFKTNRISIAVSVS